MAVDYGYPAPPPPGAPPQAPPTGYPAPPPGFPPQAPPPNGYPPQAPPNGYPPPMMAGAPAAAGPLMAAPVQYPAAPVGKWTTGCCGCFENMEACCCALWCPCVAFGRVAEIITDGGVACEEAAAIWCAIEYCLCLGCVYSFGFRTKLRAKYNLPGDSIHDFLMHWCCECCSFSQEYRELKNRGWKPADGYRANIMRFQAGAAPPTQFMTK